MSAPTPDCDRTNLLLVDYAYGELAGPELAEVEKHLPGCARCRTDLEALSSTRKVMSSLEPVPAPEAGLESLLAYAEQQAARQAKPKKAAWMRWLSAAIPVAAVATLVLVVSSNLRPTGPSLPNSDSEFGSGKVSEVVAAAPAAPAAKQEQAEPAKLAEDKAPPKADAQARPAPVEAEVPMQAALAAKPAPAKPAEMPRPLPPPADQAVAATGTKAPLAPDVPPRMDHDEAKPAAQVANLDKGLVDSKQQQSKAGASDELAAATAHHARETLEADDARDTPRAAGPAAKGGRTMGKADSLAQNSMPTAPAGAAAGAARPMDGDMAGGLTHGFLAKESVIGGARGGEDQADAKVAPKNKAKDIAVNERPAEKAERKKSEADEPAPAATRMAQTPPPAPPAQPVAQPSYRQVPAPEVATAAPSAAPEKTVAASADLDGVAEESGHYQRDAERAQKHRSASLVETLQAAYLAQSKGQHAEAARHFRAAYEQDPSGPRAAEALFGSAQELAASGQTQQALSAYQEVASRFGGSSQAPQALAQAADLAQQIGDSSKATVFRDRLSQEYPNSSFNRPQGGGGTVMKPGQYAAPARAESPKKKAAKPMAPKMDFEDRELAAPAPAAAPPAVDSAK